ncbi:MAG: endospore germination permease [Lutispora sp.]|nr:endospore germination permease [Lutispora sp.]MDD4835002.1 endospore germination permease [Lutispora sp.]
MEEGKIGNIEMLCIIVNAIVCKAFFTSITAVIQRVGTAGWYMTLISAALALAVFSLVSVLIKAYPGKNILEIFDEVLGIKLGRLHTFIICLILLLASSITLREFADATKVYLLHETPPGFIVGLFIIAIIFVSFLGLESIGRAAKLFSYPLILAFIIVIVLSSQRFQAFGIYPLFGYGIDTTLKNGIVRSSAYGEVILLGIFAKALNNSKDLKGIGYKSLIISSALVSTVLLSVILSFPYFIAGELMDPLYIIASLIDYGRFLQRIEVVFIFTWNLSTLIGLTAVFYGSISCYAHIFNIKDKRPIIISFAITLYILTLIVPTTSIMIDYVVPNFRQLGWIGFYLPILTAWLIWFFFKRRKQADAKEN